MKKIIGTVQSGFNDASKWLTIFAEVYADWLGEPVFPGSLNIETGARFDWHAEDLLPYRRRFSLLPHGGERDLFMIPARIIRPDLQHCWLWTTTTAADNRHDPSVVELVAPVKLRETLGLDDGSCIEFEYPNEWANKTAHQTR